MEGDEQQSSSDQSYVLSADEDSLSSDDDSLSEDDEQVEVIQVGGHQPSTKKGGRGLSSIWKLFIKKG